MTDLFSLSSKYPSLSVIGTGKNTGKTVTVNYLIASGIAAGYVPALTSTGRDGEPYDTVSALAKPAIYLPEQAVLATSTPGGGDARLEILAATGLGNALGEIFIARVREAGSVEVCGPERTADLRRVVAMLQEYAAWVVVDGAIDRLAASAPAVTDAVILATGAAIGSSLEQIVGQTVHTARMLLTPLASNLGEQGRALLAAGKTGSQDRQGRVRQIPLTTAVDGPQAILDYLDADNNCLLLGGALSEPLAELLTRASWQIPGLTVVVRDGTRIFVGPERWRFLARRAKIRAAYPINLLAITVNPQDPRGRQLSAGGLIAGLQKLLPELLIVNPMAEGGTADDGD